MLQAQLLPTIHQNHPLMHRRVPQPRPQLRLRHPLMHQHQNHLQLQLKHPLMHRRKPQLMPRLFPQLQPRHPLMPHRHLPHLHASLLDRRHPPVSVMFPSAAPMNVRVENQIAECALRAMRVEAAVLPVETCVQTAPTAALGGAKTMGNVRRPTDERAASAAQLDCAGCWRIKRKYICDRKKQKRSIV